MVDGWEPWATMAFGIDVLGGFRALRPRANSLAHSARHFVPHFETRGLS